MPKNKKRDQDGIHQRQGSPFWWTATPNGRGGSTRRSTGIRIDQDPEGLKAAALRASWIATESTTPPPPGRTWDDLMLAYLREVTPTKRAPERDHTSCRVLRRSCVRSYCDCPNRKPGAIPSTRARVCAVSTEGCFRPRSICAMNGWDKPAASATSACDMPAARRADLKRAAIMPQLSHIALFLLAL